MKNKKILLISLFLVLIVGLIFFTGCDVQVSETKDNNLFTTKKTTTKVGTSGITTETKNCPFWDRDC